MDVPFVDSPKTQKSKYLEKETLVSIQIKKCSLYAKGYNTVKNSFFLA